MRHKSEGKRRICCPTASTFAGPWIPPPARTTRGIKYGWQVDSMTNIIQCCKLFFIMNWNCYEFVIGNVIKYPTDVIKSCQFVTFSQNEHYFK